MRSGAEARSQLERGSPRGTQMASPKRGFFLAELVPPRCFQKVKPKPRGGQRAPVSEAPRCGRPARSVCIPVPRRLGQNLSYTFFFAENLTSVFFPTPGSPWERRGAWRAWRTREKRECLLGLRGGLCSIYLTLPDFLLGLLSNFLLGELRDFGNHLLLLLHTLCHYNFLLTHSQSASLLLPKQIKV